MAVSSQAAAYLCEFRTPLAAFCLPVIDMQNDCYGNALRHMSVTPSSGFTRPTTIKTRPAVECTEICNAIKRFKDVTRQRDSKMELIEQFRNELEEYLTNALPNMSGRVVRLEIYGSMKNGFGTNDCDVDMSLVFLPSKPNWVNCNGDVVMKEVAKVLVDYPKTLDERFIAAKVPIVRFRGVNMDIEADISYNNQLALFNTCLLRQYCEWDQARLPALGVWIKTWAKRCGIGDASKGGLSSYAWIIMLIYYLQNVGKPGLLRHLQQEPKSGIKQREMVTGYDVYFWKFVDPHETTKRNMSLHDIFVGFLDFYVSFFQFRRHDMVQIRSDNWLDSQRPDRFKCHTICIQDPFEIDHNLGQGVDGEMLEYIIQCLMKSKTIMLDSSNRERFLTERGIVELSQMDGQLIKDYADFLLHSCTLDCPPPVRHFFRDRTMSSCTNIRNHNNNSL